MFKSLFGMVAATAAASGSAVAADGGGEAARPAYAAGQVWEYRTRPGEESSRLKIRKIEEAGGEDRQIYHISIAGLDLGRSDVPGLIQHAPVSRETLDVSVTRLSEPNGMDFSDVEEGIAEWRSARGGVFTIGVAEIVEVAARALAGAPVER